MSTSLLRHAFSIAGFQYTSTIFESRQVEFHIKPGNHPLRCPCCKSTNVIRRGQKPRRFRAVPIGNKEVFIILDLLRIGCRDCGAVRQIKVSFAEPRRSFTRAFERYVLDLSRMMTIQDVAQHLKVGWDMIKNIQKRHLLKHYAKPKLSHLRFLAIDEIAVAKGHRYLTVVMDLESGAIVFVGDGKDSDSLKPFFKRLKRSDANIEAVSIDMSPAYIQAVKRHLKFASLVFNHFHVDKLFNDKLSKFRCYLQRDADRIEKSVFKGTRWRLLKNPENLDDKHNDQQRLEEAIFSALEHNPALSAQRLQIDISREKIKAERATFYPELYASASRTKSEAERRVGSVHEPIGVTDERTSYSLEVTDLIPTGTRISAGVTMDGTVSSLYSDQFVGRMGFTVTQALLQGMSPRANMALLNQARLDYKLSQAELKAIAQQVVFDVEKAFWKLYLALQAVQIRERSVLLAERQTEETKQRIAVGKLADLELIAAEAELATRQVALLDARSDLDRARLELTYLLNNPVESGWEQFVMPLDEPVIPNDSLAPLGQHLKLGKMYRPDLLQARIELKKGRIALVHTRNGLLPRLDLFINIGGSAYSQSFGDATPDFQTPYYDVNAELKLTLPVPGSRKTAEHRQMSLSLKEQELLLDNMERLLERDIRIAYLEAEQVRERIDATRIVRELQEANYSAELEKFRVGKSTNLQVAIVQRNVTEAQLEETRTRISYLTPLMSLYLAEGALLERSGIEPVKSQD